MSKVEKVMEKQTKKMESMDNWKKIHWMPANQIAQLKGVPLFPAKISPNDVKQGALGDCCFMSTLAALATDERWVKNLFVDKETNPKGQYQVNFYQNGLPIQIQIDDSFPCIYE